MKGPLHDHLLVGNSYKSSASRTTGDFKGTSDMVATIVQGHSCCWG